MTSMPDPTQRPIVPSRTPEQPVDLRIVPQGPADPSATTEADVVSEVGGWGLLQQVLTKREHTLNAALLLLIVIIPATAVVLAAAGMIASSIAGMTGGYSLIAAMLGFWISRRRRRTHDLLDPVHEAPTQDAS